MTAWTACILPHRHDPERARKAIDGLLVCPGCLSRLEMQLAEIPGRYDALTEQACSGTSGGVHDETRPPMTPGIADLRADVRGKLASWARMVAEERSILPPRDADVARLCSWLLVHLRWCCAQPWVDEMAGEVGEMWARSLGAQQAARHRPFPVGACPETECGGMLWALVREEDDPAPSEIRCDGEAMHTYPALQWRHLGERITGKPMSGRMAG